MSRSCAGWESIPKDQNSPLEIFWTIKKLERPSLRVQKLLPRSCGRVIAVLGGREGVGMAAQGLFSRFRGDFKIPGGLISSPDDGIWTFQRHSGEVDNGGGYSG